MASDITSDLTTSEVTSNLNIPTFTARSDDFPSLRKEPSKQPPTLSLKGYEGVDWTRLKDLQVPQDSFAIKRYGIYGHGWRLYSAKSDTYYWLCRRCHLAKRTNSSFGPVIYNTTLATSAAGAHLRKAHNIDQKGNLIPQKRPFSSDWSQTGCDEGSAAKNEFAVLLTTIISKRCYTTG